jgi:hypothetical protein
MNDPAAIERSVLACVALADCWISGSAIRRRLGLIDEETTAALSALIRSGDLDWNGFVPDALDLMSYHLPYRYVTWPLPAEWVVAS